MPSLSGGGAERIVVTILRHLDRSRFEPHLALVEVSGPYLEEVPAEVEIHDLQAKRVRQAVPAIVRLCRQLRPHAIHSTLCELNMATVLLRPFLPSRVRLLIREGTSPTAQNAFARNRPWVWNWLYRVLYPRADKVICVGDFVADDLANNLGVPRKKLVRIYNPIDIESLRNAANAAPNPYAGDGPHLVAAGRLSKEKGFDVLLDAMPRVCAALPNAQLAILGEGACRADLLAQRARLGLNEIVHFAGFEHSPQPYLKYADLAVLPSRYEGMPGVVIEALAVGTPVVASDCPGAVREILHDCPLARLVEPANPEALAQAIVSALTDKPLRPDGGLDAYLTRFDATARVRDYEREFEA